MAISNSYATKLNKMNRAAQNVTLGTLIQQLQSGSATLTSYIGASGSYTVTAAEMNGSRVVLSLPITAKGWLVSMYRSGSNVSQFTNVSASTVGKLEISTALLSGSSGLRTNDVITYMAFA
jgi:hypothetical protein